MPAPIETFCVDEVAAERSELLEEDAPSPLQRRKSSGDRLAGPWLFMLTAGGTLGLLAVSAIVLSRSHNETAWRSAIGRFENLSASCGHQLRWKAHPDMCVVAKGTNAYHGLEVVIEKCGTAMHGEWKHSGNNSTVELATHAGLCLDVRGARDTDGTVMQLWDCPTAANFTVANDSTLRWTRHPSKCVGVAWNSANPGTHLQIWKCAGNPVMQTFSFAACDFNCPRQLFWPAQGRCLSTNGWDLKHGVQLVPGPCQGDGVGATQFLFNETGGKIQLALNTRLCAEVHDSSLRLGLCDATDQEFRVLKSVLYWMRNHTSNWSNQSHPALPVGPTWPFRVASGTPQPMQVSVCQALNHPTEQFRVPSHLPCPRQLKWASHPDLCMGTLSWHIGNGERVVLAPCEAGTKVGQRQHWLLEKDGKIRLASSPSYCLDVHDHSEKDGAYLQLMQCFDGDPDQVFSGSEGLLHHDEAIQQGSRCVSVREEVPMAYTALEMMECDTSNWYSHQTFSADVCQNEEHAQPPPAQRRGSFLVLGDWGWDHFVHGNVEKSDCQKAIGSAMAHKMEELGDVQFIINVGDSFYPDGLSSPGDPRWTTQWHDRYPGILRSVPWYSIYGNHDAHHDPGMCKDADGAQLNKYRNNLDRLFMPDYNWNIHHGDLDLEVVGLDLNKFVNGWNATTPAKDLILSDCEFSSCPEHCINNSDRRASEAFDLVQDRHANSTAKNLVIFSHYPTDYFASVPGFLDLLRDRSREIAYFSGHRHNTDQKSTGKTGPHDWLVGGGGGWGCDGSEQGYVVATIDQDYRLRTYPVLINPEVCCPKMRATTTTVLSK